MASAVGRLKSVACSIHTHRYMALTQCAACATWCRVFSTSSSSWVTHHRHPPVHNHRHPQHTPSDQDFLDLLGDENKERAKKKLHKVKPARSLDDAGSHPEADKSKKISAVLVPLCLVKGEPSLLFTLRSHRLKAHRGDVSFPGGNVDESDHDVAHTALRETEEELGIDPSAWEIWGQMQPVPSSDLKRLTHPIVASTGELEPSSLHINTEEVAEAFAVSLRHLCHHANVRSTQFRHMNGYTLPVYHRTKHRIWGLTAIMVHQALSAIAPHLYQFKLRHRRRAR